MMPATIVFPADRPGDATYAALAAQVEAGLARVVQERRTTQRRSRKDRDEGERSVEARVGQRRRAQPLPARPALFVTV